MNFLIVDDSNILRKKIAGYIDTIGHTVAGEAINGQDAIEQYQKRTIDIVTMDMEMPILNGVDASMEILKIDPKAKIVMITSSVDKKEILHCLRIGVKKVMQKPVSLEEFTTAIYEIG